MPEGFYLLKEFYALQLESREVLRDIAQENPKLGLFLFNLNDRLDILSQCLAPTSQQPSSDSINISAGGVGFLSDHFIEPGTVLVLKMNLNPAYLGIACYGLVKHCKLAGKGNYYATGVEFLVLNEVDEKIIDRYIINKQDEQTA